MFCIAIKCALQEKLSNGIHCYSSKVSKHNLTDSILSRNILLS